MAGLARVQVIGIAAAFLFCAEAMAQTTRPAVIELKIVDKPAEEGMANYPLEYFPRMQHTFANSKGRLVVKVEGNTVRFDTNGDGVVDDKDAPAIQPTKGENWTRVKFAWTYAGKPAEYTFRVRVTESDSRAWVAMASTMALEGKFGESAVQIVDRDMDGRFGTEGDVLCIDGKVLQWSRTMQFGGSLYRVEMASADTQLKLTPHTGPVAEVQVQVAAPIRTGSVTLEESSKNQIGHCDESKPQLFLPGQYRLATGSLMSGTDEESDALFGSHAEGQYPLELKPGKNVVRVGPPLKMSFVAHRRGTAVVEVASVEILGQAGETYQPFVRKDRGDEFATYIRSGKQEQKITDLGFG